MLFLAAFIWGTAFVAQSVGMDYLGPLSFNGARFLMGSAVLLPVIVFNRTRGIKEGKPVSGWKDTVAGGVCCGLVLCAAALLQQYGILYTTVGKAGFITTLYIILVPFFGIFLKKKIPGKVWAGAAIAAFGMYLLCMSESLSLGRGDTLVFLCAVLFSVHILVIDYFSPKADGVELSCIQFLTAGVIGSILAFVFERHCPPGLCGDPFQRRGLHPAGGGTEGHGSHHRLPDSEPGVRGFHAGWLGDPGAGPDRKRADGVRPCLRRRDPCTASRKEGGRRLKVT